jgi:hypothetical protein
MNIMPIVELISNAGLGVKGKTLFAQYMPADVPLGILVIPSQTRTEIHPYIPKYRKGRFQVIVRAANYIDGEELSNQIIESLMNYNGEVNGIKFSNIRAVSEPIPFPPSSGNKTEFSLNFQAVYISNLNF